MKPKLYEIVRRNRIRLSIAAYAYEYHYPPVMSDSDYDALSLVVHQTINIATGNHRLDRFFQRHFNPDTSLWIHKHPNPSALANTYARYYYQPKKRRKKRRR